MIPDFAYQSVWLTILLLLCIKHSGFLLKHDDYESLRNRESSGYRGGLLLLFFVSLYFGLRPISMIFPDMTGYAFSYSFDSYEVSAVRNEPVWQVVKYICHELLSFNVNLWFLSVALIAFSFKFAACKKIFGNHIYTAFLFLLTSFSFWANAVTTLRSNMGIAFVMYAIALFLDDNNKNKVWAFIWFILGFYTHSSSILLAACFLVSYYFIKHIKWAIYIWLFCLMLSLFAHSFFEQLFLSLGFDDRMAMIDSANVDYSGFAYSGFRWDFLAYSIIPLLLGLFVFPRDSKNTVYSILLNTYILSNAFWVLVIRAQFSDRFASISWSMYPLVLAYPFIFINVWDDSQPGKLNLALWGQMMFLLFMQIYYTIRIS